MQENKKMMMNKKGYSKGGASGKTISDADKARVAKILCDESGKTISDADRAKLLKETMKRKGGGSAMKKKGYAKGGATRIF
jgi:hypothetical protein